MAASLAVAFLFFAAACGDTAEESDSGPEYYRESSNPSPPSAPAAGTARPIRVRHEPDHGHSVGSMELAFNILEDHGLDPTYDADCWWEYADKRPQSHWRCEVSGERYTVHITPVGNPVNYVTDGWKFSADVADSPYTLVADAPMEEGPESYVGDDSETYIDPTGVDVNTFCETHVCIGDFENAQGNIAMCSDGTWTHSGGIQGACSHHGGLAYGAGSAGDVDVADPNDDGSSVNWCGASRDGDGDGLWCEGR